MRSRNIPRALLIAGPVIAGTYIAATVCLLLALPSEEVGNLEGIMQAVVQVEKRVGLSGLAPLMAGLITIGGVGMCGAWLATTARLPFVAGLDRYLPAAFARLHPRWGTPVFALSAQAALAGLVALLGQAGATVQGAYAVLVRMALIPTYIPFLFLFAAIIRLQGEPAGPQVVRVPGGRAGALPRRTRLCRDDYFHRARRGAAGGRGEQKLGGGKGRRPRVVAYRDWECRLRLRKTEIENEVNRCYETTIGSVPGAAEVALHSPRGTQEKRRGSLWVVAARAVSERDSSAPAVRNPLLNTRSVRCIPDLQ